MSLFTKIIFESQVCTFRVVLVRVYNKEFMGEIYKFKMSCDFSYNRCIKV